MKVYVEYAFLENFLFDSVLLWLSLRASLTPVRVWRVVLSAAIGASFALLYPLLTLPVFWLQILKISVGFLLCLVATPSIKTKNERGRYALNAIFFFVFSFGFGGVLLAIYGMDFSPPTYLVMICFAVLAAFASYFVRFLYKKRAINRFLYDCCLFFGRKEAKTVGFLDSGNLARKNGLPVCFLSPDLFYELFEEEMWEDGGQVCDEMEISTLCGVEKLPIIQGEIAVFVSKQEQKQAAYFACSKHMIAREYKVLLSAYLWEGDEERRKS